MNSTRSKRRGSTTATSGCTVRAYFLEQMDDSEKRRVVRAYRSKLIAIWNWCARKRIVENFPTVEKMPEPLTLPCAWTGDQLRSLMAACYRTNGTIADIPAGYWWSALHLGRDADAVADTLWDAFETNAGGNKTGNNRSDSHSESAEKKPQPLWVSSLLKSGRQDSNQRPFDPQSCFRGDATSSQTPANPLYRSVFRRSSPAVKWEKST
jgi:hypothetical protein